MTEDSFAVFALKRIVLPLAFGICLGTSIKYYTFTNSIPRTDKVQQGYVVPSKLEIKLEDLDGNEQKETILKYDGKQYLLTLDKQGNPRVQAYEVKPAEVIPKE